MGEVNNPAAKGQENSPPKIITQHSHTSGSEPEDEHNEYAPVERDVEMQDPEYEFEDGSQDTNKDVGDPDNKEEHDHFMFNFDDELPKEEDEDQTDVGYEERNVPKDQPIPEQTKTN